MKIEDLKTWIGREISVHDTASPAPAQALAATLDNPSGTAPGDPLPALWHWLYFLTACPTAELGPDGHPPKGDFLPPVDLPRRMWAGSRLQFVAPLRIAQAMTRRSVIQDITVKQGHSGPLCFVLVRHEVSSGKQLCLVEEQDIVYRPAAGTEPASTSTKSDTPAPAATWARQALAVLAGAVGRDAAVGFDVAAFSQQRHCAALCARCVDGACLRHAGHCRAKGCGLKQYLPALGDDDAAVGVADRCVDRGRIQL